MPMLMPPTQYDVPPKIPLIERVVSWNELQRFCRGVIEREKFRTATGYALFARRKVQNVSSWGEDQTN